MQRSFLRIPFPRDMTLSQCVVGSRSYKATQCPHLQGTIGPRVLGYKAANTSNLAYVLLLNNKCYVLHLSDCESFTDTWDLATAVRETTVRVRNLLAYKLVRNSGGSRPTLLTCTELRTRFFT